MGIFMISLLSHDDIVLRNALISAMSLSHLRKHN